jgi:hypothetical protein
MLRTRVTRLLPLVAAIAAVVVLSAPAGAKDIGGDWFRGDLDDATLLIG